MGGYSSKINYRFMQMIEDITQRDFVAINVWKIDRFPHDKYDSVVLKML